MNCNKIFLILEEFYTQSTFLLISLMLFPIAKVFSLLAPLEELWLMGENSGRLLHDNGFVFFQYCRRNYPEKHVFFVTTKDKRQKEFSHQKDSNIIEYRSLKHVFYFLLADTLVFSHSHSDVASIQIIRLLKRRCTRVFLQHGVIAFKKIHKTYRRGHNEMDIFVVSSEFEKNIVLNNFDVKPTSVKVAGLARYDKLTPNSSVCDKKILYMPTWRDWAFPSAAGVQVINGITNLLTDRRLHLLLAQFNLKFNFYIHNNMIRYIRDLDLPQYLSTITPEHRPLQKIINESILFITDYSSVAWDFYYLEKPVLFYQFDQQEYLSRKGSYINFDRELFGEVHTNCDTLLNDLRKYIESNFSESSKYSRRRDAYFSFRDRNNCKRIYQSIINFHDKDN